MLAHPQEHEVPINEAGYILSFTLADIIITKNRYFSTTRIIEKGRKAEKIRIKRVANRVGRP